MPHPYHSRAKRRRAIARHQFQPRYSKWTGRRALSLRKSISRRRGSHSSSTKGTAVLEEGLYSINTSKHVSDTGIPHEIITCCFFMCSARCCEIEGILRTIEYVSHGVY